MAVIEVRARNTATTFRYKTRRRVPSVGVTLLFATPRDSTKWSRADGWQPISTSSRSYPR